MTSKTEKKLRKHMINILNENPVGNLTVFDKSEQLYYQELDEDTRNKYLYGEWHCTPLDALVLYTKGNRTDIKYIFGNANIHYVNTRYSDVQDIVLGNRYREIIVLDNGVKQEDIGLAMEYKWRGK